MTIPARDRDEWVVVLEFVPAGPDDPFEHGALHALVDKLRPWHPAALVSDDRYAVQLQVPADRSIEALQHGLAVHDQAVAALGIPSPVLVHTDVLSGTEDNAAPAQLTFDLSLDDDQLFESSVSALVADARAVLSRAWGPPA